MGTRDARNGTSRAWTALGLALQVNMLLPRFADAAKRIHDALFGDDVSLVDLDALSMWGQWGQSFRLLTRIDGEGFAAELDAMGLGVFVEQARAATSALGEITGANGTPAAAPEPAEIEVAEAHEHFNVALSRYARVLAASVDERRPESIRRFVGALEALDAMKKSTLGGDRDDASRRRIGPRPALVDTASTLVEPLRMPVVLRLRPDVGGPREWIEAECVTPAVPALQAGHRVRVLLRQRTTTGPTWGHVSRISPAAHVVDGRTVAFQLLDAGPASSTVAMPPGAYDVEVQTPAWVGLGGLRFQASPTTPLLRAASSFRTGITAFGRGVVVPALTPSARTVAGGLAAAFPGLRTLAPGLFFGLVPSLLTELMAIEQRGAARRSSVLAAASSPGSSVEPLVDGAANHAAIARLIAEAEQYLYVATAVLDDTTGLEQGPAAPRSIAVLLKERATAVWRATGRLLDIKLLLFDPSKLPWTSWPVDPDGWLGPRFGSVRSASLVHRPWRELKNLPFTHPTGPNVLSELRRSGPPGEGSHAPEQLLRELFNRYHDHRAQLRDDDWIAFPSGVQVVQQAHEDFLGCHHQKLVITEKAMWIGGLNLQKQYWDDPAHLMHDMRRAHSGEGPSSPPAAPNVPPWHDTGAIVRGALLEEATAMFARRWDASVASRGAYGPVSDEVAGLGIAALHTALERFAPTLSDTRIRQPSPPYGSTPDPAHLVDAAALAVTLPEDPTFAPGGNVTQIRDMYFGAVRKMDQPGSFMYFENQYFTHYELAGAILQRWEQNVAQGAEVAEELPPFAYFVLPYEGDPQIDYFERSGRWASMPEVEMGILKWLEVSTARKILVRDALTGRWVYAWGVARPERDVERLQPIGLAWWHQFEVRNVVPLDPATGEPVPGGQRETKRFRLDEILTEGDIMSFTLTANRRQVAPPTQSEIHPSTYSGPPRDRLHAFLHENAIYLHSKSATFYNQRSGVYLATIGSANLNPRGFDDVDPDGEANVFWSGSGSVVGYRDALWAHLCGRQVGPRVFAAIGMENLDKILGGSGSRLEGHVVRLDVVERYRRV